MTKNENIVNLRNLSPRALETLYDLSKDSGHENVGRTIEEMIFAIRELLQLIDTKKDPLLEPEAVQQQMSMLHGILQRFKRFKE